MNAPLAPSHAPSHAAGQSETFAGQLLSLSETDALIRSGRYLSIAADESLLRRLPLGNWIAGTIPYFMGENGGESSREKLFVTPLPDCASRVEIREYDISNLNRVCRDAPNNGFSLIIIPAFSTLHSVFAHDGPGFDDMFVKPLVGWIAGTHLDDLKSATPMVVDGRSGNFLHESAVVFHVELPSERWAQIDIINPFQPGGGDTILFPETGFSAENCMINGIPCNFADYLIRKSHDLCLPLVADYSGAMLNVSIKSLDKNRRSVDFYAPVFEDVTYYLAAPVPDYGAAFRSAIPKTPLPLAFSCNCILNYLYGNLEGQHTSQMVGPITFGEIAYQLLNQTLVYLTVEG